MRQDGLPPSGKTSNLAHYFSQIDHPHQLETLGRIAVEILRENKPVSRRIICLKLIGCLETATNEDDASHYRELLTLLFRQ
ncbi:biofilm development protein YmgB/AriR [Pantoea sp. PNA 14-12]|uniref:biofilm development regulator YmgB/AriR family protein n=1 Tax=Pantoea TaxID=53335 RepID=UPI00050F29D2|nr:MULTISPECIES: biofilm development regulator YmgB/AriR family protein [Pantoea]KKW51878.1 hypothetical protein XB02_03390 [Pantoea ananatis]KGD83593.1 hypothetical protein HA47_11810 [Pantoea stewartii subsp. indologenes]KHE00610.1 hypothetical protein NL54_14210 [Pantoea stewartii]KHN61107.1 hypothetical protein OI73_16970 [Pantoea stewartii]MBC0856188.1 hypothetical protein [Pantoea stewartii]